MKERPILFSAPMVRAILDGRKTVTRRVVTVPWKGSVRTMPYEPYWLVEEGKLLFMDVNDGGEFKPTQSPYGAAGDRLWVKETWQYADWTEDGYPFIRYRGDGASLLRETGLPESLHEDVWSVLSLPKNYNIDGKAADRKWRPSIFMPRWASRILLEVVSVRVERLHEITGHEVLAEGVENGSSNPAMGKRWENMQRMAFQPLWDGINKDRGYGWDANPWVWRVEFRMVES